MRNDAANWARFAPGLFVLLWSTGFIGAKYGLPHAEPLTFLFVRYLLVISAFAVIAWASGAPWPRQWREWGHIGVAGLLLHGVYLGGVFVAIHQGLPAGIVSLVAGLQPLLTAAMAGVLLREGVAPRQWIGLVLGLVGAALVLSGRIAGGAGLSGLLAAVLGLLGITAGTMYQKRFCPSFDWRSGAVAQFLPAAIVTGIVAAVTESMQVEWNGDFVFALCWLVLVVSIGAISLLNYLIRSGSAVNVASLFYLVPASTAVIAWLMFDETLSPLAIGGMGLSLWGVSLARK
ncbi:MAG: DMT family transporter [Rhodocyclaceae bacterium]|nr:DMT family transporter [Rhodocyclaceae bacterium]